MGVHQKRYERVNRVCSRAECDNFFTTKPSNPKIFCSQSCAAIVNNSRRTLSKKTKDTISKSLLGRTYPERRYQNAASRSATFKICQNPDCKKRFATTYWRPSTNPTRYCSVKCSIHVTGSKPTSPKAARAKAGIRADIDSGIYFFSRWEANYARLLNFNKKAWVHQPKRFKLKSQYYTPDFYLPESDEYVEIKNYLSAYSLKRDKEFREMYPKLKLKLVLKNEYKKLEEKYASLIPKWEFNSSKWPVP